MSGLFSASIGIGEHLFVVFNAAGVSSVQPASMIVVTRDLKNGAFTTYDPPKTPTFRTVVNCGREKVYVLEPVEIVMKLWTKALYDTLGSPGVWMAQPPEAAPRTKHESNPEVEVIGNPVGWRIGRRAVE